MKQNPARLLKQTVIKMPDGKTGTLLSFGFQNQPPYKSGWAVMIEGERFARFISCDEIKKCELV